MASSFLKFCVIFISIGYYMASCQEVSYLANLDEFCLRCLCVAASTCNLEAGCDSGYCGPYQISRVYWKDAGEVTLPDDEKRRYEAYQDCALSYSCAQRIVKNYFSKFGKDCNNDGVTNCDDYAMINFNGGWNCQKPLNETDAGLLYLERYKKCNPHSHL